MSALLLATALAVGVSGCGTQVVNPVTGQAERSAMDERAELAAGKKAHQQVTAEYGVYKHPRLQAYVNEIGQKLAKQSHRAHIPWTFTVLDSPEINAFALPGGYIYITRGILAYMESEADMAAVIGHEIAHVTARHGVQRATRQQDASLGVLAATVLGAVLESQVGMSGGTEMLGQMAQGVAAGYVATYSREQELQADTLSAEYLARTGYDPKNMVNVLQMLKSLEQFDNDLAKAEGRPVREHDSWLASHPRTEQRLESIRQIAAQYQGRYAADGNQRYFQMIEGMRYGDSPEQGLTRGQQFYHPGLGFAMTAAPGWRIQNEPGALSFISPQGDAALKLLPVPPQAGQTHEQILKNGFKATQGQITRSTIGGFAATHFTGVRQVAAGRTEPLQVTVLSGPSQAHYAMVYLAADAAARQRAFASLTATEKSFRAMTAADQQAARPWQLRLVPFPRGGFAELARRSALPEKRLQLLNGTWGGNDPPVGQMVKTVVEQ
ncbi:MAG: peptidase [Comamonadaceae bacterium]|nr:peptidase [Comamonadaceae bacterium]